MSTKRAFLLFASVLFLLLTCGPAGLQAQGDDADDLAPLPMLSVDLWLDRNGGAIVGVRSEAQPLETALPRKPFEAALGGTIQPAEAKDKYLNPEDWQLLGRCDGMFSRKGGLRQGKIDLGPLLPLLHSQKIRWVSISVMQSPQPYSYATGLRRYSGRSSRRVFYSQMIDLTKPGELQTPITLSYGYAPGDAAKIVLPLLLVLLVPFGLTLWMRDKALRAEERAAAAGRAIDPAVVWFGYGRYLQGLSTGIWIVWFPLVIALHSIAFTDFLVGRSWVAHSGLPLLAIYLPALVIIGCYGLSHPVFAQIGGQDYTRGEMLTQAAWGQGRLLPLICLLTGASEFAGDPRVAVAWFAGAFLLNTFTMQGAAKALGTLPQALLVGELRDSVFALAKRAGVPVRQVYLMPAGKGRMANAFASLGSTVLLTEFLLQRLSKREVDAIVGHELTHLKRRHPQALQAAYFAIFLAAGALTVYTQMRTTFAAFSGIAYSVVTVAGLLLAYGLGRRFEWQADAGAVALTGDGEALITGLAKISALNQTPLHWGKWQEKWLTHPPTLRRMERIGLAAGVPPERIQVLARPEADTLETPEDFYAVPKLEPDTRVFGVRRKSQLQQSIHWTGLLAPPLIAALAVLAGSWPAAAVGLVLAVLLPTLLVEQIQQRWYGSLETALRQKMLESGWLTPGEAAEFVAYSPSPLPRLYEGFYDFDLGFLQFSNSRLRFTGEKTEFSLSPARLVSVEITTDTPGLWRRRPRLSLRWQDTDTLPPTWHAFSLRPGASGSLGQSRLAVFEVKRRLDEWRGTASFPPSAEEMPERLPLRQEVTALSPRQVVTGRIFGQLLLPRLGFAAGIGILFGLSFGIDPAQWQDIKSVGGWYVLLTTFIVLLAGLVPLWRYRDRT